MSIAIELVLSLLCMTPAIELLLSACKWMVKTLIISRFCLNAVDGILIFVLNIIIIIISI